jgi:hypothetical protein
VPNSERRLAASYLGFGVSAGVRFFHPVRRLAGERVVVAAINPDLSVLVRLAISRLQHQNRGIVGVDPFGVHHVHADRFNQCT